MARRRPEFEPGFAGAEAAKLEKFSDAGGSQIQWLSDDARNQFLKLFVYTSIKGLDEKYIDHWVKKLELDTVYKKAKLHG